MAARAWLAEGVSAPAPDLTEELRVMLQGRTINEVMNALLNTVASIIVSCFDKDDQVAIASEFSEQLLGVVLDPPARRDDITLQ